MKAVNLPDNRMAIFFPFHIVTEMTVARAMPSYTLQQVAKRGQQIKFAAETVRTAGTKRMNSEEMQNNFPIECAMVRQAGYDLSKYVLIEIQ